jgi:sortase A
LLFRERHQGSHPAAARTIPHISAQSRPWQGGPFYAAHRDTHFAFLGEVAIGDEIRVTRHDGATFRFRVTGTDVVRWDASGIDPLAPGRRLVLATCWPLDGKFSGPLRYVVRADIADRAAAEP